MPRRPEPTLTPVGEDALLVEYAPVISPEINRHVRRLAEAIERSRIDGVIEVIPAYRSLMVYFDAGRTTPDDLGARILGLSDRPIAKRAAAGRVFRIPTLYGGEHGPDLERVAEATGLSPAEVIRLFSAPRYPVYCLGFLCGLAYLGGVPAPLRLPRLATPRTWLPAGSVGFAGTQAVVLPIDQPSGFHYIGRTFVSVYDPARLPPTPVRPGDCIECPSVSESEAMEWSGRWLGDCVDACVPGD